MNHKYTLILNKLALALQRYISIFRDIFVKAMNKILYQEIDLNRYFA